MWKEFNINTYIELTREDGTIFDYVVIDWEGRSIKLDGRKYYVAKESEHIFEPKQGDEGRCVGRVGAYYFNYNGQDWAGHSSNASDKPIIIMRDNKHFFNPLIENND